jgi:hypothetical protein
MKLTDEQIAYFKKRVFYWCDYFKLQDWQISCGVDVESPFIAYCASDSVKHSATVWLKPEWENDNITKETLDRTALHEVAHILTADFMHIVDKRINEQTVNRIAETFAVRMTNALTGKFDDEL